MKSMKNLEEKQLGSCDYQSSACSSLIINSYGNCSTTNSTEQIAIHETDGFPVLNNCIMDLVRHVKNPVDMLKGVFHKNHKREVKGQ